MRSIFFIPSDEMPVSRRAGATMKRKVTCEGKRIPDLKFKEGWDEVYENAWLRQ